MKNKIISLLFVIIVFISTVCAAEENVYEFSIIPYSKEVLDKNHEMIFKYFFLDGLMSSLKIITNNNSRINEKELIIKRNSNSVQVYNSDNSIIMNCEMLDKENLVIEVMNLPSKFFVTAKENIIYCGIDNEVYERFFRIKQNKPVTILFRQNAMPINKWPLVDFNITEENESRIQFIEHQGHYKKINDGIFEDVSNDKNDQLPSYRCVFSRKLDDYQFTAIDIFIDYFCGSTLSYPIIWGQLIGNSKNMYLWN